MTAKEVVTQFAAEIEEWRKPEPYKGKGIFVNGGDYPSQEQEDQSDLFRAFLLLYFFLGGGILCYDISCIVYLCSLQVSSYLIYYHTFISLGKDGLF